MLLGLNDVWRETARRVERQAGVLFTIAAAFLLIPGLLLLKLNPALAAANAKPMTLAELGPLLPWFLVAFLVQLFGQLSLVAVATDEGRSTVGEAMRRAFLALPRVIAAFIVLILGLSIAATLLAFIVGVTVAMIIGTSPGAAERAARLIVVVLLTPWLYAMLRLSLFVPIAVIERAGPVQSLKASWRATKGHLLSILAILALSLIGMLAAQGLAGIVLGGAGRAIGALLGSTLPTFLATVLVSATGAIATVYFTMLLTVIWLRLRSTVAVRG